jgi:FkbM family methyltransferase
LIFKAFGYYLNSIFTLLRGLRHPGVILSFLTSEPQKSAAFVQLKNGDVYTISSLMDLWILKETVLDRQYEQASLPLEQDWTVVDVGAAFGDYSVWAARQLSRGRLIAVEPYPPSITLLQRNLQANQVTNVELFNGAITSSEGTAGLSIRKDKSVQNTTSGELGTSHSLMVKTIDLKGLFGEFSIHHCDYLKMDCEGGEYDILFSTPAETLAQIERMCMEIHDDVTHYSRNDMIRFLQQAGYQTRLTPNPVHEELAYLYAVKSSLLKGRS